MLPRAMPEQYPHKHFAPCVPLARFVTLLVAALCFSAIATAPPAFSKSIKAVPGNKATIPPGSTADVNGSTARIKGGFTGRYSCVCASNADAIGCVVIAFWK